jgi:hypothetical protein
MNQLHIHGFNTFFYFWGSNTLYVIFLKFKISEILHDVAFDITYNFNFLIIMYIITYIHPS